MTREFTDENGSPWHAVAVDAVVAHGRQGAALGFRPADESGAEAEPLLSTVTFNSRDAAEATLRSLSEKELRRRLEIARVTGGGV